MNWFSDLMRFFFFHIDQVIFSGISKIYNLLITIARTSPLSQADIASMAQNVYRLIAVFMIFKVIFSLIMYVVNPDDFTDKGKGISKLTVNIILSLSLLILTPYLFRLVYTFQTFVLEDNSIAALVLGEEAADGSSKEFFSSAGEDMAYIALSPFFVPDSSVKGLNGCINVTVVDQVTGKPIFNEDCSGLQPNSENPTGSSKGLYYLTSEADSENTTFNLSMLLNYVNGVEHRNTGLAFRKNLVLAKTSDGEYIMDYSYVFSTAIGVVIILLLIGFCMDVAVRSIKLAFLELVSPIPILSYIDPKSGKEGLFKKWYKLCISTYLSLFIRLVALYFAVFLISKVSQLRLIDVVDGSYITSVWVSVFVMIGALMFAKQAPNILKDLGIKLDGDGFTLNPLKKIEKQALGGKQMVGLAKSLPAAGLAGAAAFGANLATTRSSFKNAKGAKAKAASIFSSVGGAVGATRRGVASALKGEKAGKVFTNSFSGAMKAKHDRIARSQNDITTLDRAKHRWTSMTGGQTLTERLKNQVAAVENGDGEKTGFVQAMKRKYGEAEGTTRAEKLLVSPKAHSTNKELEKEKEVYSSRKAHLESVIGAKDIMEKSVSKRGDVSMLTRNLSSFDSRTDADYIDGKFGSLIDRYRTDFDRGDYARYFARDATAAEKSSILSKAAARARKEDRQSVKDALDKEIVRTLASDLSSSDAGIKAAARDMVEGIVFKAKSADDPSGKIKAILDPFLTDGKVDYDKLQTNVQVGDFLKLFDANTGAVTSAAKEIQISTDAEISSIEDILSARNIQTSELQNSESARHAEAVAGSFDKK